MRLLGVTLTTLVMGLLVTACSTPAEPIPLPTPSSTMVTADEDLVAAAEATYRAYVDATNTIDLQDPDSLGETLRWTTGNARENWVKSYDQFRREKLVVSGSSKVISSEVYEGLQDLQESQPQSVLTLQVCLDVSTVDLTRPDGASTVTDDRPDVQDLLITFDRSTQTSSGLAVSGIHSREGQAKC